MRCIPYELHAHEMPANEVQAYDMHAHKMRDCRHTFS
jgi:hypothetical protein